MVDLDTHTHCLYACVYEEVIAMFIRTNIVLDQKKLDLAKALTHMKTTREVVDYALDRLTKTSEAFKEIQKSAGKIKFSKTYSYKKLR